MPATARSTTAAAALVEVPASWPRALDGTPAMPAALPALHAIFGATLDAATCGIVIADARRPGLPILYVNRRFETLTGYTADEVLGRSCSILQSGDSAQPGLHTLREAIAGGQACRVTLRNYRRDGSPFVNELQLVPVRGADGRLEHYIGVQTDVSERVQAEDRVREVLERIDEAFITLDSGWRFTYANPSAERLLQRPAHELRGAVLWSLFPDAVGSAMQQRYQEALRSQRAVTFVDYDARLGKWFEVRAFPLSDGLTVFFRDVTRQKDHDARLEYQASHDTSTGLWNQRSLVRELALRLPEARRQGSPLGVVVLALDGHRELGAHFGHALAEQLVCELANRLRQGLAAEVALARTAADEFMLLVPAADRATLQQHAERCLRRLAEPVGVGGHDLRAELAAGTSWQPEDGADATTLIANARAALASAGAPGQVVAFSADMRERAERRRQLLGAMQEPAFLDQLTLHYQPQQRLADGGLAGLEALMRWRSPTLGAVSPGEFIPLAERSGLIETLGRWTIETVCRQIAAWRHAGLAPPPVSVNASAREVLRADYAPTLLRTLQAHGLRPDCLCVEVTESVAIDGFEQIRPTLAALADAGVQVHLDDFGAGYCNLRRLQWLHIHTLKVDRSLVAGLDDDPAARAMLRAIVELARSLRQQVLVEGIETEGECAAVRDCGCDVVQGYLISRPVRAEDLRLPAA